MRSAARVGATLRLPLARSPRWPGALLALLLAGCTVDTDVPGSAQLGCVRTADCPADFQCLEAVGRCVPRSASDTTPPALAAPLQPEPALLRTGAATALVVQVSEPLALPPTVTLEPRGRAPRALVLDAAASSAERHVFRYTATGDEPEGEDVPVRVLLVDRGGNPASLATALRFDHTPPRLDAVGVSGVPARAGGTFRVSLAVSEDLAAPPTVRRGAGGPALTLAAQPAGGRAFELTGTAAGTEAGAEDLVVAVTDAAGNTAERTLPGALTFDFAPPAVAEAQVLTPFVREGFSAVVRVAFSEPLPQGPVLQLEPRAGGAPLALTVGEALGAQYTLLHRVEAADAAGTYDVVLVGGADAAGNAAARAVLGSVDVDKAGPRFTAGPTLDRAPALYRAGVALQLDFALDEPPGAPPDVRLGGAAGRPLACTATSALAFRCTTGVAASDPEGLTGVAIALVDRAGNASAASAPLTLDFTPPAVGGGQLWFLPAAGNPLQQGLTALGVGTTARVSFNLSEPAGAPPALVAVRGDSQLVFTPVAGAGLVYSHTLAAGPWEQGAYALQVTAQDAAGNTATQTLAVQPLALVVDTLPPAAPSVAQGGLVFHRQPWGAADGEGEAAFWVDGPAGTAEAGALLRLLDGGGAGAGELSRQRVQADGAVAAQWAGSIDRATVWAQAVDGAGNAGVAVDVREVEWLASPGRKRPGSLLENPTRVLTTPRLLPFRDPYLPEAREPSADALARLVDGASDGLAVPTERRWRVLGGVGQGPTAGAAGAQATDLARGKVVVFGGGDSGNDTWELDLVTGAWVRRVPVGAAPSARSGPALVYDARRGRVLLFGGYTRLGHATDVWAWDGSAGLWTRLDSDAGPRPGGRTRVQVTFDAHRDRLVVFGGSSRELDAQLWEFDPAAGTWEDRTPAQLPALWPAGRQQGSFVYDPVRRVAVLVGGTDDIYDGAAGFTDVWEWSGASGTWARHTPAVHPLPAADAAAAWDPVRRRVVVHGGSQRGEDWSTSYGTLWEWDGAAWTDRTPAAGSPVLAGHALSPDPLRGGLLLLSPDATGLRGHLWLSAEGRFVEVAAGQPPERHDTRAASDARRGAVYVFGGLTPGSVSLRDLWRYDVATGRWKDLTPAVLPASWPSARSNAALVHDPVRDRLVLHGGHLGLRDLWVYALDTGTWTELTPPPGTGPGARSKHALVHDAARDRFVLVGGELPGGAATAETWEWAPTPAPAGTWTLASASGLPARHSAAAGFDAARGVTVVFGGTVGGSVARDDVWEWSGSAWADRTPAQRPSSWPTARGAMQSAWDPVAGELLLQGGCSNDCYSARVGEVWRYHAASATFTRDPVDANVPAYRDGYGAFDPVRGRFLMGGNAFGGGPDWEYATGATERPALLWHVPFAAAGAQGPVTVRSVQLRAGAGGRGVLEGAATLGAQAWGWSAVTGEWRPLGLPSTAGPGAGALSVTLQDAASIAELRQAEGDTFTFALAPVAPAGGGGGELWVDALELVVRYRR